MELFVNRRNEWQTYFLSKTLESPLDCKEIQPVHSGDQPWDFFGRNDAKAEAPVLWPTHAKSWLIRRTEAEAETPILWAPDVKNWLTRKDPDAGKDWRQEGANRGWRGWMASLTQWTWVWVSSGSWWWTGKPGVLQPMGSQRVGHDWETELSQIHIYCIVLNLIHMNDLRTYPLNVKRNEW